MVIAFLSKTYQFRYVDEALVDGSPACAAVLPVALAAR
jgi:hypothetical protein